MRPTIPLKDKLSAERAAVVFFILAKLALCLFPFEYGFFRDELYYIAMSDNLDFGYVDVPPLVPFLLAIVRSILGTSFLALHLLPAICGALVVWLVSLMVRELGGGFYALLLALTCVTLAPIYLCWESTYSYDVFDKLNWTLMLYVMVLILKTEDRKYWIYFGLVTGIGLMTKITILFLAFGLLSALLMTAGRKHFLSRQLWAGGILAILLFSPYLIWQIKQGLPALEYYGNYAAAKTAQTNAWTFIKDQIVIMNFLAAPVWILGIYYFLFNRNGRRYRVLGYGYLVTLILCIVLEVKFFLPTPFYTVLFAGGAVWIEQISEQRKVSWLKRAPAAAILVLGLIQVPIARPVIPIELFSKLTGRSIWEGTKGERHKLGHLPQHFHDRFGWEEMAKSVATVYGRLSEEDKSEACILMSNYGEAGAIWVLGEKYGLPKPVSGHLQYYLWGPRGHSGDVVIAMGFKLEQLRNCFDHVEWAYSHSCKSAIPYEKSLTIYLCRKPRRPLEEMWPEFKHLD